MKLGGVPVGRLGAAHIGDVAAVGIQHAEELAQPGLRVFGMIGDRGPARLVEPEIEPRQHDGTAGQAGDDLHQLGGRRDAAGRSGDDYRRIGPRLPEPFGFERHQSIAAVDRIEQPDLVQMRGPGTHDDVEEAERKLLMPGEALRQQLGEARQVDPLGLGLVHQPHQLQRQLGGSGGRVGDPQARLAGHPAALDVPRPGKHELGQRHAPVERADGRGNG